MERGNTSISVIIPCYNDGKFLPETLAHLSKQTLQPKEIIIVNDGSTDTATLEILAQLEGEKVRILHKTNGRMSSARNHAVKAATGEIIVALDADDYFAPDFFEKGIAVLQAHPDVAVVTSYMKFFGNRKGVSKPRGGNQYNFMFNSACPACAMVRKEVWDEVGGYDESMTLGYEDWEFYIRVTQKGWNVHVIPEYLFFYRQTDKSTLKNSTEPHRKEIVKYIVEKHKDWYIACMIDLIADKSLLYTESRASYPLILKLLKDRISGKYV